MNRFHLSFIVGAAALAAITGSAQTEDKTAAHGKHRVVFEVTHEGQDQWIAALNNVENLRQALGANDSEIEVVCHSKGLGMLIGKNNTLADRMKKLADAGVVFAACENTMKKKNVTKDQLVPFAKPVDSGVAETVRKEEAGWSYLKAGV